MARNFLLVGALITAPLLYGATTPAAACTSDDINCSQPTGVGKGNEVPIWFVVDCVVGPEGGPYTRIACDDPAAVHISPRGKEAVCFIGSDRKIHYDLPGWVWKGRKFFNHKINGSWQPHWVE